MCVCVVGGGTWGGAVRDKVLGPPWGGLANYLSSWQISSVLQTGRPNSYLQRFLSLQHSFLCCAFAIVLGGGCFLLTALHLERDQAQARQAGKGTPTLRALLDSEHWQLPMLLDSSFQIIYYVPAMCQAR